MRALIFSDIHIHNYPSQNESRLVKCIDCLKAVFQAAKDEGYKTILFCGDLYDQGKKLHPLVVDAVLNTLREAFRDNPDVTFYAISGNHDQAGHHLIAKPTQTALSHLVKVFPGRFVLLDNQTMEIEDCLVHGVPYYVKVSDARQMIAERNKEIVRGKVNILLNHQHHPGCEFGADFIIEDVDNFNYVFTGHIHRHQPYLQQNMFSVGSPLWRDAADYNDPKGWLYLDTDNGIVSRYQYEMIPMPVLTVKPVALFGSHKLDDPENPLESVETIITSFVRDSFPDNELKQTEYIKAGLNYIQ